MRFGHVMICGLHMYFVRSPFAGYYRDMKKQLQRKRIRLAQRTTVSSSSSSSLSSASSSALPAHAPELLRPTSLMPGPLAAQKRDKCNEKHVLSQVAETDGETNRERTKTEEEAEKEEKEEEEDEIVTSEEEDNVDKEEDKEKNNQKPNSISQNAREHVSNNNARHPTAASQQQHAPSAHAPTEAYDEEEDGHLFIVRGDIR